MHSGRVEECKSEGDSSLVFGLAHTSDDVDAIISGIMASSSTGEAANMCTEAIIVLGTYDDCEMVENHCFAASSDVSLSGELDLPDHVLGSCKIYVVQEEEHSFSGCSSLESPNLEALFKVDHQVQRQQPLWLTCCTVNAEGPASGRKMQ